MIQNLDALAEKIYKEGIEKAETRADEIEKEAREKATEIVDKANKEANEIKSAAEKEAKAIKQNASADIRLAAQQAMSKLKQELKSCIIASVLKDPIHQSFDDTTFLQSLILAVCKNMTTESDLSVVIPQHLKEETENALSNSIHKELLNVTLKFKDSIQSGFRVEIHDKGYTLSFTEEDFIAYFKPFINKKTEEILFNNSE